MTVTRLGGDRANPCQKNRAPSPSLSPFPHHARIPAPPPPPPLSPPWSRCRSAPGQAARQRVRSPRIALLRLGPHWQSRLPSLKRVASIRAIERARGARTGRDLDLVALARRARWSLLGSIKAVESVMIGDSEIVSGEPPPGPFEDPSRSWSHHIRATTCPGCGRMTRITSEQHARTSRVKDSKSRASESDHPRPSRCQCLPSVRVAAVHDGRVGGIRSVGWETKSGTGTSAPSPIRTSATAQACATATATTATTATTTAAAPAVASSSSSSSSAARAEIAASSIHWQRVGAVCIPVGSGFSLFASAP